MSTGFSQSASGKPNAQLVPTEHHRDKSPTRHTGARRSHAPYRHLQGAMLAVSDKDCFKHQGRGLSDDDAKSLHPVRNWLDGRERPHDGPFAVLSGLALSLVKTWSDGVTQFNVAKHRPNRAGSTSHGCSGNPGIGVGLVGTYNDPLNLQKQVVLEVRPPIKAKQHPHDAKTRRHNQCDRSHSGESSLYLHLRQVHGSTIVSLRDARHGEPVIRTQSSETSSSPADPGDTASHRETGGQYHGDRLNVSPRFGSSFSPGSDTLGEHSPADGQDQGNLTLTTLVENPPSSRTGLLLACRAWRNDRAGNDHKSCKQGYENESRLFQHERRRHNLCLCIKCLTKFPTEDDWKHHRDYSPYLCSTCSSCFNTKAARDDQHNCNPARKVPDRDDPAEFWQRVYEVIFDDGVRHDPFFRNEVSFAVSTYGNLSSSSHERRGLSNPSSIATRSADESNLLPSTDHALQHENRNEFLPSSIGIPANAESGEQSGLVGLYQAFEHALSVLNSVSGINSQEEIGSRDSIITDAIGVLNWRWDNYLSHRALSTEASSSSNQAFQFTAIARPHGHVNMASSGSAAFDGSRSGVDMSSFLTDEYGCYFPNPRMTLQTVSGHEMPTNLTRPSSHNMDSSHHRHAPGERGIHDETGGLVMASPEPDQSIQQRLGSAYVNDDFSQGADHHVLENTRLATASSDFWFQTPTGQHLINPAAQSSIRRHPTAESSEIATAYSTQAQGDMLSGDYPADLDIGDFVDLDGAS